MSKNKKLNKHKGPLKFSEKKFNDKRFEFEGSPKLLRGGEFAYIALDSCAVINLAAVECGHFSNRSFKDRKDLNLIHNLEELLHGSAIKHGFVCDRGRYVLCIVPAVLEEIDMDGKKYSETIHRLLDENFLKLEVKPEYKAQFDELTKKITQEFKDHNLFISPYGTFMENDAKITAQAAIFNLAIASQDKHLIEQSNGHREHIKFWSSKHLPGDHNGHQSVPMALCEIMNMIRNEVHLPELENSFILENETRKQLERLKYKPCEYSRPNPTLTALQTPTQKSEQRTPFQITGKRLSVAFSRQHE